MATVLTVGLAVTGRTPGIRYAHAPCRTTANTAGTSVPRVTSTEPEAAAARRVTAGTDGAAVSARRSTAAAGTGAPVGPGPRTSAADVRSGSTEASARSGSDAAVSSGV